MTWEGTFMYAAPIPDGDQQPWNPCPQRPLPATTFTTIPSAEAIAEQVVEAMRQERVDEAAEVIDKIEEQILEMFEEGRIEKADFVALLRNVLRARSLV